MAMHSSKTARVTFCVAFLLVMLACLASSAAPASTPAVTSSSPRTDPSPHWSRHKGSGPKSSSPHVTYPTSTTRAQKFSHKHKVHHKKRPTETRIEVSGNTHKTNVGGWQSRYPATRYSNYETQTYAPLRKSFQAISYVRDIVPKTLFKLSGSHDKVPFQSATVTERTNALAKSYFDAYDENEMLTKIQERTKIFFGGNPAIVPKFKNIEKERRAIEKLNKLFVHFKTQRANKVFKKQSGK